MKALIVGVSLLLPTFAAAQDKSPEDAFKELEQKYATAKAHAMVVRVIAEASVDNSKPVISTLEGEFVKKTGRKLRLGLWGKVDGEDYIINLAANGEFMAIAMTGMEKIQQIKAPENLDSDMAAAVIRTGLFGSIHLSMGVSTGGGRDGNSRDLRAMFPVSDFKAAKDEAIEIRSGKTLAEKIKIDCKSFTFQVAIGETKKVCDARVWYDPKTMTVIRRSITWGARVEGRDVKNVVTEIYENAAFFTKDEELPADKEFKLPDEKK